MTRIYFAHPAFTDKQRELKAAVLEHISGIPGVQILDPFEHSPDIEGDREAKKRMAGAVVDANIQLMNQSDLMIAIIDDRDQGVTWEMGYGRAIGMPTISVSGEDFDVNLMLSHTVMAHITQVRTNGASLRSIVETFHKVRNLEQSNSTGSAA